MQNVKTDYQRTMTGKTLNPTTLFIKNRGFNSELKINHGICSIPSIPSIRRILGNCSFFREFPIQYSIYLMECTSIH